MKYTSDRVLIPRGAVEVARDGVDIFRDRDLANSHNDVCGDARSFFNFSVDVHGTPAEETLSTRCGSAKSGGGGHVKPIRNICIFLQ